MIHHAAIIHHKAHVDIDCHVGAGTRICQFASVTRGTVLGEDCTVWPFAMLDGSTFGDRCKIASGVAMGAGFLVGNDVFIGPNVTICNDMWPEVSKEGYDDKRLRLGIDFAVIIGDRASIGAGVIILPGVRIGSDSMIAAGTVVHQDVPAGVVVSPLWPDARPIDRVRSRQNRMRWVGK